MSNKSNSNANGQNITDNKNKNEDEAYIKIRGITKTFGKRKVLDNIDLDIEKGEFLSLLGPSGCGKTTLLRIIAGFEEADSGSVYVDGVDILKLPANERPTNMMFQSYALFPHMNVFDNIAFGLYQDGLPKDKVERKVRRLLKLVHLEDVADQYPHELSGGQSQRVALARCIAKKPKVVLLDEPMAALDKQLRESTQFELVNIQEEIGITFIMVTHDQEEAMTMSSRVAIMQGGHIKQVGNPHEIYEYPNSTSVAKFFGNVNIFKGIAREVNEEENIAMVTVPGLEVDIQGYANNLIAQNSEVFVAIRPEKVKISKEKPVISHCNWVRGKVDEIAYLGDVSIYHVRIDLTKETTKRRRVKNPLNDDGEIIILSTVANLVRRADYTITWEDEVYLSWGKEFVMLFNE